MLGLGESLERRARGILNPMIKSLENLLGSNVANSIMKEVSSLVADGTSVNIRHNNGLWNIFQEYRLEKFSEYVAPLLAILCFANKSSIAWKAASNVIPEIKIC